MYLYVLVILQLVYFASFSPLLASDSDNEGVLRSMSCSSIEEMDCGSDNSSSDELPDAAAHVLPTDNAWNNAVVNRQAQMIQPSNPAPEVRNRSAVAAEKACECIYQDNFNLSAAYLTQAVTDPQYPMSAERFYKFFRSQYELRDTYNREAAAALAHQIGMCYEYGFGVAKNLAYAIQYYGISKNGKFIYAEDAYDRALGKK